MQLVGAFSVPTEVRRPWRGHQVSESLKEGRPGDNEGQAFFLLLHRDYTWRFPLSSRNYDSNVVFFAKLFTCCRASLCTLLFHLGKPVSCQRIDFLILILQKKKRSWVRWRELAGVKSNLDVFSLFWNSLHQVVKSSFFVSINLISEKWLLSVSFGLHFINLAWSVFSMRL